VDGAVSGYTTQTDRAAFCDAAVLTPFPYAEVAITGGANAFTALDGSYTIANPGETDVIVTSGNDGQYFDVIDYVSGRDEVLSQTVTPPGPADFVHNPSITPEYVVAQANGYIHANQGRDFILQYHPTYPTISTQLNFPISVNRTDGYCPGNAWYDYSSLNFCASGGSYPNTSFASVSHHEYGHHVVSTGGSGQGAYGEGMSDCIAMLFADDPGLGYGFFGDCDTSLRTADNNCQYLASGCSTCGSESHSCGQLLSGVVWDIREALEVTNPSDYLDIVTSLTINSVLLHTGTTITSAIAEDFLILDDDDGNIGNGTPHRTEICSGFEAHSLECPELESGMDVTPDQGFDAIGEQGGPFTPSSADYVIENLGPGEISFSVAADATWLDLSVTTGTLAVGETALLTVSINTAANALPDGDYVGNVTFTNETDHVGDHSIVINLTVGGPQPQIVWDLDTDPGWTMDEGWGFGAPLGGGTDPSSAATGVNVYGYNLSGNYTNSLPERHLTTTAIDCSNLTDVSLHYERWLGVETRTYDEAEISISLDGVTFTPIWQNPYTSLIDSQWIPETIDISTIADGQATVYLRWTLGPTDGSVVYGGWNIDDIAIWGVAEETTICEEDDDCNDGLYCNGLETCVENACVPGTPIVCDDDIDCTVDTCDETTDACVNTSDDGLCDDGLFCNGAETCGAEGCEDGTAVVCDDGVDCTSDSCDETADACAYVGDDTLCDDGEFCNGAEVCGAEGCEDGASVPCDDGIDCTADSCDEAADTCVNTPDDAVCDNGAFCDGVETCDVSLGCVDNIDPCTGICDEELDQCVDCEDTTLEAEDMYHSTGGSVSDGWNIWSNGYAAIDHNFEGGDTEMTVVARGEIGGGAWPHMIVSVGGATVLDMFVESASYIDIPVSFTAAAGTQEIRVSFDNDFYEPPEDRNLILDKVIVLCSGTPVTCEDGIQNGSETDIDCGGSSCPGCDLGDACLINDDCLSGACEDAICVESATCEDGTQNGSETDIDCGGPDCSGCDLGDACLIDDDCLSSACEGNICVEGPTCDDGELNGSETDIDCGGPDCPGCGLGDDCLIDDDCESNYCDANVCAEPPVGEVTADFTVTNDWTSGYCVNLDITNASPNATTSWSVTINTNGGAIYTSWNGNLSGDTGSVTITPVDWNGVIASGQTNSSVGFCLNRNGSTGYATVEAASGSF